VAFFILSRKRRMEEDQDIENSGNIPIQIPDRNPDEFQMK